MVQLRKAQAFRQMHDPQQHSGAAERLERPLRECLQGELTHPQLQQLFDH